MQVSRRASLLARAHDGRQPLHVAHAHDVYVILAAERLDQRKMDLQGDVAFVLLVGRQHAESHIVGVPAREEGFPRSGPGELRSPRRRRPPPPGPRLYSHVQDFGGLVDAGGETALALRRQQQLVQRFPGALHPADEPAP